MLTLKKPFKLLPFFDFLKLFSITSISLSPFGEAVRDRISDPEKSQFYNPSAGLYTIPDQYVV